MVAAVGAFRPLPAVISCRKKSNAYLGAACKTLDLPDQGNGAEDPAVLPEARRKVGDFDAPAMMIVQPRDKHGRIGEVLIRQGFIREEDIVQALGSF